MLRQQQRVVSLSNKIKNFNNKLDILFILFTILFFLDSRNTILSKLFFDFKNNILFDFIIFNKFFEIIKLLNTL